MKKLTTVLMTITFMFGFVTAQQVIEVIGTGVQPQKVTTLDVGPTDNITKVVMTAIYFVHDSPYDNSPVAFSNGIKTVNRVGKVGVDNIKDFCGTTQNFVGNNNVAVFIKTFKKVNEDGIITLDQLDNWISVQDGGKIHSFVAYVFRDIPGESYVSMFKKKFAFFYRNSEFPGDPCTGSNQLATVQGAWKTAFKIPATSYPRDITVEVPVTDLTDDGNDRQCFIEVSAKGMTPVLVELIVPNLGQSLNITPIVLQHVPGDVEKIKVKIWSPCDEPWPYGGDSFTTNPIVAHVTKEEQPPEEYCTLTQGFYGNEGGSFNGYTTTELLDMLLFNDPLVIGIEGNNYYSFVIETSSCVIDRLPGGGPSAALFGDDVDCTDNGYNTFNDGRIKNNLLSQTITLGLNLRLDNNLGGLALADLTFYDYSMFSEITIQDLYIMANNVLGGMNSAYNLGDITDAIGAINDYFDECNELVPDEYKTSIITPGDINQINLSIRPNPVAEYSSIKFTAVQSAHTSIDVYNLMGNKIQTIFDGVTVSNQTYTAQMDAAELPSGVYILILRNGNKMERSKFTVQ